MYQRVLLLWLFSYLIRFAYGGLFPKSSLVKMIDAKEFKQVMKLNQTSLVAFVAPWCGHCQKLVPEFNKAAKGLNPLIGTYAVDCDDEKNKRLCGQQEVKGFPTIKLFPRGKYVPPMLYEQERTAGSMYNYASRRVPKNVRSLKKMEDVKEWVEKNKGESILALLLTKESKVPLLWKVLGNKYTGTRLALGAYSDKDGQGLRELYSVGEEEEGKSTVVVWNGEEAMRYGGVAKLDGLSEYFDEMLLRPEISRDEL